MKLKKFKLPKNDSDKKTKEQSFYQIWIGGQLEHLTRVQLKKIYLYINNKVY